MAQKYLTIMPTTIDSERLASTEGNVLTPKRLALKPAKLEIIVVCKKYLKTMKIT